MTYNKVHKLKARYKRITKCTNNLEQCRYHQFKFLDTYLMPPNVKNTADLLGWLNIRIAFISRGFG